MRARAGDPPRTMTQKILAGRAEDPRLSADLAEVRVDQVILARDPKPPVIEAIAGGLKRIAVETAVAYDTRCVTDGEPDEALQHALPRAFREAMGLGLLLAKPGIGFPGPVHLERFASPARLAVTDEPRLAAVGGIGMLTLAVSPSQLAGALQRGMVCVRPPRSIQVLLSGRVRPFVCIRDVALELVRRGLPEIVERVDREHRAPVVVEFAGPSARLLSVSERAVLAALAPQLGAAAAVFVSDEKTEVFLRDQRRSKAHRGLAPDAGAPCEDVISIDLSAVDPLVMDTNGRVRPVRDLADEPVHQVILGGDSGTSLRDLMAAAALLKSKRVPPSLDLLVAPPSRQSMEVLAHSGALVDLIATGARILEPDHRLMTGELYPAPPSGLSLRTFDPEPGPHDRRFVVASAETIAYAVSTGKVGDPRGFKRPVRITVPRALPTDDVLVVRRGKAKSRVELAGKVRDDEAVHPAVCEPISTLALVAGRRELVQPSAVIVDSLDDVRWLARRAPALRPHLRAIIAPHIPRGTVPVFAGLGILALTGDPPALDHLRSATTLDLPPPEKWNGDGLAIATEEAEVTLSWLALGPERDWTRTGNAANRPVR